MVELYGVMAAQIVGNTDAQAVIAVQVMESNYGAGIYHDLFEHLRQGMTFAEAFHLAAGESLLQFHVYYGNELRRRYNILVVLSSPNVLVILLPVLVVAAYLVRRQRNRRIRARWQAEETSTVGGSMDSSWQGVDDNPADT